MTLEKREETFSARGGIAAKQNPAGDLAGRRLKVVLPSLGIFNDLRRFEVVFWHGFSGFSAKGETGKSGWF